MGCTAASFVLFCQVRARSAESKTRTRGVKNSNSLFGHTPCISSSHGFSAPRFPVSDPPSVFATLRIEIKQASLKKTTSLFTRDCASLRVCSHDASPISISCECAGRGETPDGCRTTKCIIGVSTCCHCDESRSVDWFDSPACRDLSLDQKSP